MALNSLKYQLPYIQYSLFKNYIAEKLCVRRTEANSCCQGKCFLEKQVSLASEADEDSANPAEKKQVNPQTDDYIPSKNPTSSLPKAKFWVQRDRRASAPNTAKMKPRITSSPTSRSATASR